MKKVQAKHAGGKGGEKLQLQLLFVCGRLILPSDDGSYELLVRHGPPGDITGK
jgi:hypothetical protein